MSTGDRYQIKCDLSSLTTDRQCSNCRATNSSCYARQSRRRGAPHRLSTSSTGLPPSSVESPVIATPLDRSSYTPANPPESAIKDNDTGQIKAGQHLARTPRHDADERCDTIHTSSRLAALSEGHQGHRERAYLGQSGFMSMFDHPSRDDSDQGISPLITPNQPIPELSLILRQSYAETFVEYCYPWCPVVYRDDLLDDRSPFARSLLLQQAIGLLGTTINPPRLSHQARRVHYERFKVLFHSNMERNPLVRIVAIILIYWWSAGPPSVVSMDSQYWWTSIAIRLAQEIGLHREATPGQTLRLGETATLRRCIWWTLFVSTRCPGPWRC
ncbi:hypothetical protein, variant [Cladophialophora immunda]|uniref:Xylanolytic transcriptional activator regulatory domain-containing protein n=1 Tax=Cladophialophora immunda TaxID=569365 RepID=A0A0D2CH55_9EURO|nr:hypothetical protein, variant [Cladophialophora immunda]KIW22914.1 hypothetical protein, variant [Cladophialophora immunda]